MEVIEATPSLARVRLFQATDETGLYTRTRAPNSCWNKVRFVSADYPEIRSERPPRPSKEIIREGLIIAKNAMIQADIDTGPFDQKERDRILGMAKNHYQWEYLKRIPAIKEAIRLYAKDLPPEKREDAIRQINTLWQWLDSFAARRIAFPHLPPPPGSQHPVAERLDAPYDYVSERIKAILNHPARELEMFNMARQRNFDPRD